MAMQPVVKPQETKPAPLPAYPVAPSSQTQTSSRGMVPPKHFAGGSAYAGVPKGIPHYAEGTTYTPPPDVDYRGPLQMMRGGAYQYGINSPEVALTAPGNFGGGAHRDLTRTMLGLPPQSAPTASEMMAAHRGAFAQAVFGGIAPQAPAVTAGATQGGAAAAPVAPQPTVARGVSMGPDLEPGGDGVMLKGAPYPSTPQQVATAAASTGVNAAGLQNAAGAARDAQVDPVQHALANPQQYSSGNFVNALRGVSFRHLAMVAQALRTAMPYNPQEQAWQQLHAQNNQNLRGMPDPNSLEAKALRLRDEREQMKRAGVDYIAPSFAQPPQTDPVTGEQIY